MLNNKMQPKISNEEYSDILLLDSNITKKESKILNGNFKKIITFDINSDRMLTEKKISHIVSDDFIDNYDSKSIDSACLDLCQWYNKNNGNELLSYENINLGSLFRVEFHNFLIPIIKNFLILNKVNTLYPNSNFICSANIYQIANVLEMNSVPIDDKFFNVDLTWDKIQYNITDSISFGISKNNFMKLKNLSNIISNLIIKNQTDDNSKNNFALIEFDPIKYKKIFDESNRFHGKIHLYNRHRPVFYNIESLSIIRNSKVIPHLTSKKPLKKINSKINSLEKKFLSNLEEFLNDDEFFNLFFKYNGIELWKFIKPNIMKIFKKKTFDSICEIEYAKNFLLENNLKSVILLSESGFIEQIIIGLSKKFPINIILLQHGISVFKSSSLNYNKILGGIIPLDSNYFFSWGKISSEYMEKLEFINSKIKLIGSPSLDKLIDKNNHYTKNSQNVLLLATGPRNQQSMGHNVNTWKKYESMIKSIHDSVSKHNLNLIIKRHPDIAENDFSPEFYSELSDVKIIKNGDLSEFLLDSKIVLSLGLSSAILESQVLKKPFISILVDYDTFGSIEYMSNSCLETTLENFDKTFSEIITNPDIISKLSQDGNHSVKESISNLGSSSKILFDILNKL